MTPSQLRRARKRLGLTQNELAGALRMGKNGYQSVGRWETDGNTIPGPVQVAVEHLLTCGDYIGVPRHEDSVGHGPVEKPGGG